MIGAALGALSGTAAQRAAMLQAKQRGYVVMKDSFTRDWLALPSSALMRPPRPPVSRACTYCGTTNPGHRCRSCGAPSC